MQAIKLGTVTGGQDWQPESLRMPGVDGISSATYSGAATPSPRRSPA